MAEPGSETDICEGIVFERISKEDFRDFARFHGKSGEIGPIGTYLDSDNAEQAYGAPLTSLQIDDGNRKRQTKAFELRFHDISQQLKLQCAYCTNNDRRVRPPGHHAEPTRTMGFCLFNNVAVGPYHAREEHGYRRIAVIDFDVHHGNGTQTMTCGTDGFFFASTHQTFLFPHARASNDGGEAYRNDPLGDLHLGDADFAWVTREIAEIAQQHCKGRLVSVLEGGHDPKAVASAGEAHVRALMAA